MTSLEEIQNYLNIDLTNRRLREGKKNLLKNRYIYMIIAINITLLNYHRICIVY